ncbi:succinate dehydrogenase subunit 3, partial [Trifolium medium]|nr:succinate dehydrogenase subunit 3 [Trifolium medium]
QLAPAGKPYIALLQLEGERKRKRILDKIVHFVAHKLKDPGQPQGPIYEQALR